MESSETSSFSLPDPDTIYPIKGVTSVTNIKPTVKNPRIIVGEFSYFTGTDFESHVTHHYDFNGDKLVIGKFCQIGANVEFVMNGANHQMNAVSTFPFYVSGWQQTPPPPEWLPLKGDIIVGNDVWIGQNVTVLPGVHIGDGAIIGLNSTVTKNVAPYTIVAGNPARVIRQRFDDELIALLLKLQWWNLPTSEINALIPILTNPDLQMVKEAIRKRLA